MSSSSSLSLDHLPPSEQLCYVHCNICDTVLAVLLSQIISFIVSNIYHPLSPFCFYFLRHFRFLSSFLYSLCISLICWGSWLHDRWVFLAPAYSRQLLFDVVTAPISFPSTCVGCFCLLLASFPWVTISTLLLIISWCVMASLQVSLTLTCYGLLVLIL